MKLINRFRGLGDTSKQYTADGVLVFITLVWASGFIFIKDAMSGMSPIWLMADRHVVAALVLLAIFYRRVIKHFRQLVWISALVGLFWWGGLFALTIGIKYTTASNAAFLSGLGVVLTPFAGRLWGLPAPRRAAWFGIALSAVGLMCLANHGQDWQFGYGDALCLLCALIISFQYASVSYYASRYDAITLAVLQIVWACVYSLICALAMEPFHGWSLGVHLWGDVFATGVVCTALMLIVQCMTQKYTTAVHTALVFSIEPAAGGVLAWWIFGDPLGAMQWLGCVFIVGGMIYSEIGT